MLRLSRVVPKTPFLRAASTGSDTFQKNAQPVYESILEEIKEAGTFKKERVITTPQQLHSGGIGVQGDSNKVINFCANNYLGLADNPRLIAAAKAMMDSRGLGLASVRFICGTQDIHKQLEQAASKFHGTDDTILYSSCFDANGGLFETILTPEDAIITDALNHASIIDGIRLCKAKRLVFDHMNMDDLETKLKEASSARLRLISTDGVFSMDGDVAPLADICRLADKYNALVHVDDAHSTGFMGATGRGTAEHTGVGDRVDVTTSTLGKALGGASGGYTTGRQAIIDVLRQRSRTYLFSNSLAPPIVGAALEMFSMLSDDTSWRDTLARNTTYFRDAMTKAGFQIRPGEHPIVPIMLGDASLAAAFADDMLQHGIYVIGFSFPVVPKGKARIRVQMSAGHSIEDLQRAVDAFIAVGKQRGVIQ